MTPTIPKVDTQAWKILRALLAAKGNWVSGNYFLRTLFLSQYHARIHNLENNFGWKGKIEHSDFTDEHGFVLFRIVDEGVTPPML